MPIGKSKRFDVFTRDNFTCQYCGEQPPSVVLEVDHIHPVSKGGTDEDLNLITACFNCNRGKRAKVLSHIQPRPDADHAFLRLQQEAAEMKRYLKAKKDLDQVNGLVLERLIAIWCENITDGYHPKRAEMLQWLKRYGAEEVEIAIVIAGRKWGKHTGPQDWVCSKAQPWVGAILRNRENRNAA